MTRARRLSCVTLDNPTIGRVKVLTVSVASCFIHVSTRTGPTFDTCGGILTVLVLLYADDVALTSRHFTVAVSHNAPRRGVEAGLKVKLVFRVVDCGDLFDVDYVVDKGIPYAMTMTGQHHQVSPIRNG